MKGKDLATAIAASMTHGTWKPKSQYGNIWLERKVSDGTEYIGFGTSKNVEYGFRFYGSVTYKKRFNVVEEILKPMYKEHDLSFLHRTIHFKSDENFTCPDIHVNNKEMVQNVMPWINERFETDIIPFMEKYQTLESVHQRILELPKAKLSRFIYHPPVIIILTIKGILKTDDYDDFRDWALEVYEGMAKDVNSQDYKKFQILKQLSAYFAERH